ncbi:MAG: PilC/PilY family type IV pilus protein [Polyangiales bacterium]
MKRKALSTLALAAAVTTASVSAQAQPDIRLIRPNIMTMLDNSGSMEWRVSSRVVCGGVGTPPDGGECNRCSNGASMCSPSCPASEQRNRWTTALEVLTGSIQNYTCLEAPRTDSSSYDYLYQIPHHLPLSNGVPLFRAGAAQSNDGIFDVYADRVRFGLMTFDNDQRPGLAAYDGMFSYAANRDLRFNYPGCPTYTVNLGARRASVDNNYSDQVPGGLISVGSPSADTAALGLINRQIQESLTGRASTMTAAEVPGLRPYGQTPIAAMLEDVLNYWRTNSDVTDGSMGGSGDPYFNCRTRANLLITDGAPNMDFRYNSGASCEGGTGHCPYQRPELTAMEMAMMGPGNPAVRTYVLAFNALDSEVSSALEPIAIAGNTSRVYYASDRPSFAAALSSILDTITSVTSTRTPPVFGEAGTPSAVGTTQYQFNASFTVAPGVPWSGNLVRTRTTCEAPSMGAAPVPTPQTPDQNQNDDFAFNLRRTQRDARGWGQRYLWTFVPTGATTPAAMQGPILNGQSTAVGQARELDATLDPRLFSYTSSGEVNTMLAWLRGEPGTVRENRPLGDIYRSTPTFVAAPAINLQDQTFLQYRQRGLPATGRRRSAVLVGTREPMLYVGTNDGILHAFNADSGEEAWGFVPPYLVPQLRSGYPTSRTQGVDGTPVVKEVYYERSSGSLSDDSVWRTVMVVGLRNGGGAYVALDVTDPYNPSFLWQFTDSDLRVSSGTPAIGTVFVTIPSGNPILPATGAPVERAVAFLPGGTGQLSASCSATAPGGAMPSRPNSLLSPVRGSGRGASRTNHRCWDGDTGQFLYVVDLKTGALLRKLGTGSGSNQATGSPIVGSPGLYNGVAGVVTTRAYVGDADGVLWRADFSSRDPSQWWMTDVYDLFWDRGYDAGRMIVERPAITVDSQERTVVAFGSGDPDQLEGTDENRVASFTESVLTDSSGIAAAIQMTPNWEIRPGPQTTDRDFFAGERLTGQLTLFNNVLYFGTFVPQSNTADPCQIGFARLWGVDMQADDPAGSYYPKPRLDLDGNTSTTADIVRVTRDLNNNGTEMDDGNDLLFGVAVARNATCNLAATALDPLTGSPRTYVSSSTGGDYRLVLQVARSSGTVGATNTFTFSRNLATPYLPARIDSWATIFE